MVDISEDMVIAKDDFILGQSVYGHCTKCSGGDGKMTYATARYSRPDPTGECMGIDAPGFDDVRLYLETILTLNAFDEENFTAQEWKLQNDISSYPSLSSDYLLVDALYNLSLDETMMNKEEDGTFCTGEAWPGVWTRDVSYSILLSYAIIDPEFSKNSLLRKIKRDRIIQDTGSGEHGRCHQTEPPGPWQPGRSTKPQVIRIGWQKPTRLSKIR